ncbi:MAG: hypothetical protein H0X67_20450 [Acidobacteria bacterium]|nr:hypothetical protein [Acidobacteriota bacterium]
MFRVTHPFHPLTGRTFDVVSVTQTWGEYRVFYADDAGALAAMPLTWPMSPSPIRSSPSRVGEPTVGCLICSGCVS